MTDRNASEVTLPLPNGGHLAGTVTLTGAADCVLYVHGFGSDRSGNKASAIQNACARRGWSCAAFDFRGHGGSSGTMRQLRGSGLQSDLKAVSTYLSGRGVRRLFLVGSSMGGFASAWFALAHPELVQAVVLAAPAFRFLERGWLSMPEEEQRRWQEQGVMRFTNQWVDVELEIGFVEERDQFALPHLAQKWQTPALIFHGVRDEVVPWEDNVELVRQTPFAGIQLRLLGDGDHRLTAYLDELAEEACRFFARWIGA
jgi:pimeloyl-ACP methyl ester carboxylesterase